ncbi:MAG: CRISPR-associated protein Cas4 [Desulfopila sp.]
MYAEDDLLMISALQHLLFCPRQCALIHIEQQWAENVYTAEGRVLHERVHTVGKESRKKTKIEFDVPLRSLRLGLIGRADIVEFHLQEDGIWQPVPVEYKRGRPKTGPSDRVQLCAQAICLEEMLKTNVTAGALYYGQKKRRQEVFFDTALRDLTGESAEMLHGLLRSGVTPPPRYTPACESCSLLEVCLPQTVGKKRPVEHYLKNVMIS